VNLPLALSSLALLALAGALELWWGAAARRQRRDSLAHVEGRLPRAAPAQAPLPPAASRLAAALPWDGALRRAALPPGWRVPALLAASGLLLALLAAWRVGTPWMAPAVLGVYAALAWLWLRRRAEKLQRQFLRQLPDFLDNMVRLAGIGNSLPMAFQAAAAQVTPPLRGLLDGTLLYVRTGLDLDRALQLAAQPYRLDALNLLHVVLGTGVRIGGRADHILQRMSDFMRDLDQSRRELGATTSETRMSAWVLGLLPLAVGLLMTLANPAFFRPMFEQPLGHKLLLAALALETLGGVLLYRLAKSL
jgi:tight adherence protein B